MSTFFYYLSFVAAAAVLVVLVMGLWNMAKAGSPNRSQSLMRMRVMLQALVLAILLGFLWLSGR
jgi:biotin transporter BioY